MYRRNFIKSNTLAAMAVSGASLLPNFLRGSSFKDGKNPTRHTLGIVLYPRKNWIFFSIKILGHNLIPKWVIPWAITCRMMELTIALPYQPQ